MAIRFVSWNVNGIRALSAKEDWRWFSGQTADIVALQETKAAKEQLAPELADPSGWHSSWCSSTLKKGYSGVAVFSRRQPLGISAELDVPAYQGEGRLLHLEYEKFHFLNGYFPNGGAEILDADGKHQGSFKRLEYKMGFLAAFADYAERLRRSKPLVICGDFNIAHKPVDLARPKDNELSTGFLPVEREFLDRFCSLGYVDTFRHVHGDQSAAYSWWSYRMRARAKNIGWRIDYFFVSKELEGAIEDAWIESSQFGSDHCPVGLSLAI